jgi:hypothetical protein
MSVESCGYRLGPLWREELDAQGMLLLIGEIARVAPRLNLE